MKYRVIGRELQFTREGWYLSLISIFSILLYAITTLPEFAFLSLALAMALLTDLILLVSAGDIKGVVLERTRYTSRILLESTGEFAMRCYVRVRAPIYVTVVDPVSEKLKIVEGSNKVEGRGLINLGYVVKPIMRGRCRIGPPTIFLNSLLGLFKIKGDIVPSAPLEVYVVPKFYLTALMPSKMSTLKSYTPGGHPIKLRGIGEDLLGFREYLPGDDVRYIHWPTTARNPKRVPIVKELSSEALFHVFVVIDPSPLTSLKYRHDRRIIDDLVEAAGEILLHAFKLGDPAGIHISGVPALTIHPTRKFELIKLALSNLEKLESCSESIIRRLPDVAGRVLKGGSVILILSPLDTIKPSQALEIATALRALRHKPIFIIPFTPSYVRLRHPLGIYLKETLRQELDRVLSVAEAVAKGGGDVALSKPENYVMDALNSYISLRGVGSVALAWQNPR